MMKCIHGIDSRFCAVCNKSIEPKRPLAALGDVSLEEILRYLNDQQVRATYGAVAEVLGAIPRSMGARLGPHRPQASWIVNSVNGLPTDYSEADWHPALLSNADIITTGRTLILRLAAWRGIHRHP